MLTVATLLSTLILYLWAPEIQGWADADHSPQTSGKAKNVWSYKFIPPYAFICETTVIHRENATCDNFYLIINLFISK
jgi:hypothetical protein